MNLLPNNVTYGTNQKSRSFWLLLIVITVFAACIRLYRLGEYPQSFNSDEMSSGYEAWSLWTTGSDHHGNFLPLHVRRYNDYAPALLLYFAAPIVGLLGPDEFSARLLYALMGIGAVFMTALLGQRWFGTNAGLLAALFLSVDPWAVNFSRMAYPLGGVPLLIVLSLYTFSRFVELLRPDFNSPREVIIWAGLCAVFFAMLTLAYEPMKLQGPLLLATCILAARSRLWQRRRLAIAWIGFYVLLITPLLIDHILHGSLLQKHFGELSLIGSSDWVLMIVLNYLMQYNPIGYFFTGVNRTIEVAVMPGIGELFWLEGVLWVAAAIALARRSSLSAQVGFSLPVLLGIWFATYPFAASMTAVPTSHREINFLPLPELLAGFGAAVILERLTRTRFKHRAALYGGVVPGFVLFGCFTGLFLQSYFMTPLLESDAPPATIPYNIGLRPALDYLQSHAEPCDEIWLEPTFAAYMNYLYLTRYPPLKFQHAYVFEMEDKSGWLHIPWLDGIWFAVPGESPSYHSSRIASCREKSSRVWFVGRTQRLTTWPTVFSVNNVRSESVWRVQVKERAVVLGDNSVVIKRQWPDRHDDESRHYSNGQNTKSCQHD